MARAGSSARRGGWRKVADALIVGGVAIGSLISWKRNAMAVWFMEGNKKIQEMVILTMLDNARPIIEKELKMTLPERIFSSMALTSRWRGTGEMGLRF